jgi:DNA (cytosine-5)-methyltransferase 1
MKHGSLFSGIGGFDLAAEWMGWENVFHCEWNEFGQRVLKHHFPKALSYADITKTDFNVHRGRISVLSGGFPCQPYSSAGKRLGKEDERHLWPEMLRAIREIQPRWVVGENVLGLTNWNGGLVFEEVCADLEAEGYEVQPFILPACAVNAPHVRQRVWFCAYSTNSEQGGLYISEDTRNIREDQSQVGREGCKSTDAAETNGEKRNAPDSYGSRSGQDHGQGKSELGDKGDTLPNWDNFPTEPPICSGDDGLSDRLDNITFPKWRNESIAAYGNAIVPQVAHQIFKAIEAYEESLLH